MFANCVLDTIIIKPAHLLLHTKLKYIFTIYNLHSLTIFKDIFIDKANSIIFKIKKSCAIKILSRSKVEFNVDNKQTESLEKNLPKIILNATKHQRS